jgi:hypothetical protein
MAQKATPKQVVVSTPAVPVLLFGVDATGKPRAARFGESQAELAAKAAGQLNLHVLPIIGPVVVDLAGRVPAGRIHANGRGFVPYIRRDLYAKLLAAADKPAPGDQARSEAAAAGNTAQSPPASTKGELPKRWDDIRSGHAVIAQDEPGEGWYEAIVVATHGDMLLLRWRDYPRERRISRHRLSVGLLYPLGLPAVEQDGSAAGSQAPKAKNGSKRPSPEAKSLYPKTWEDIDVDCLVLAKEDGPWRSWWEAIPTEKSEQMFVLRWRDFPQLANIARSRWVLGLLYPNGR